MARILIADDDAASCELFAEVLEREGYQVDQVQTRSLCIDPLQYLEVARGRGGGGEPVGIRELLKRLKAARPGLIIGNFARGLEERDNAAGPA